VAASLVLILGVSALLVASNLSLNSLGSLWRAYNQRWDASLRVPPLLPIGARVRSCLLKTCPAAPLPVRDSLKTRPRLTSAISGACISATANWIGRGTLSIYALHFAIWGALVSLISGWWVGTLGRAFAGRTSRWALVEKCLIDQMVTVPFFSMLFPIVHGLLQGVEPERILQTLVSTYPKSVANGWRFWPPVVLVAYAYVPPHLSAVFFSSASLVWNVMLTLVHSR
jgi:hypothetical protein